MITAKDLVDMGEFEAEIDSFIKEELVGMEYPPYRFNWDDLRMKYNFNFYVPKFKCLMELRGFEIEVIGGYYDTTVYVKWKTVSDY